MYYERYFLGGDRACQDAERPWARCMRSNRSAISLSLKVCAVSNQSPLTIIIQVWNSVRPMHLFDRNLDHDS